MSRAQPVRRGCGSRTPGGAYLECGLAAGGSPIELFLFDPPRIDVPPIWLEPHRNPMLVGHDGVYHVVIWVGEESYPSMLDFVEETRVAGASRRVSTTFDFSKLTAESRMFFVHVRAGVGLGTAPGARDLPELDAHCPKAALPGPYHGTMAHDDPTPQCLGLAAYLRESVPRGYAETAREHGRRERTLPCGHTYAVYDAPPGIELPTRPAVFMTLPITGVAIVRDAQGAVNEKVADRVRQTAVDVYEVDA